MRIAPVPPCRVGLSELTESPEDAAEHPVEWVAPARCLSVHVNPEVFGANGAPESNYVHNRPETAFLLPC